GPPTWVQQISWQQQAAHQQMVNNIPPAVQQMMYQRGVRQDRRVQQAVSVDSGATGFVGAAPALSGALTKMPTSVAMTGVHQHAVSLNGGDAIGQAVAQALQNALVNAVQRQIDANHRRHFSEVA